MTHQYITPDEIQRLATGQDWSNIFPEGVNVQDGLSDLCTRASALVDNICARDVMSAANRPYVLRASEDQEIAVTTNRLKLLVDKNYRLNFRATYRPIREVKAFEWAALPGNQGPVSWKPINLGSVYIEDRDVIATGSWGTWWETFQGRLTYINGFANGILTAQAAINDTTLTVDDALGYYPGDRLTMYAASPEIVEVASDHVPGTNPVKLSAPLRQLHPVGTRASALQPDAQQGALYVAIDMIQKSGASGFVPAQVLQLGGGEINVKYVNFWAEAERVLSPYKMTQ